MKLYAVPRSPFAARVIAAASLKGLRLVIEPIAAHELKSAAYLQLNPLGRLPTLVLDDGRPLPESEIIVEYLEQAYPEPALLPTEAWDRARARLIARAAELYVLRPLFGLFPHLAAPDDAAVNQLFAEIGQGLTAIEALLGDGAYAWGERPTLADCALAPSLFWVNQSAAMFERPSPLEAHRRLAAYDIAMRGRPVFGPLLAAMAEDLSALRGAR